MSFTFQSFCSDKQKQLIKTGAASALRAACDTHPMQMKSVKITFLQSMEHLCVLGFVQISFWPQSYILLPPDCWTLHVLKHSKGPNSAWMLRCLFLSIFTSSLSIHSGRMGTVRWPKSWVLWWPLPNSQKEPLYQVMTFTCPNIINLFNVHSLLALVASKYKTVVSLSFYLVSRFDSHHTAPATMVKLLAKGSSSLCDTNLSKLIKEVRFPC